MPTVIISSRAHDAILRASKTPTFHEEGVQLPSGDWSVPLSSEVVDRLHAARHAGESLSDTIERVIVFGTGGRLS